MIIDNENIVDYKDCSITENTRCAYPLNHIPNARIPAYIDTHPSNIIFLVNTTNHLDLRCIWSIPTYCIAGQFAGHVPFYQWIYQQDGWDRNGYIGAHCHLFCLLRGSIFGFTPLCICFIAGMLLKNDRNSYI